MIRLPDGGVVGVPGGFHQFGEERVDAAVDGDEVAERVAGAKSDRATRVTQRLAERHLQLRQERLQHHPALHTPTDHTSRQVASVQLPGARPVYTRVHNSALCHRRLAAWRSG